MVFSSLYTTFHDLIRFVRAKIPCILGLTRSVRRSSCEITLFLIDLFFNARRDHACIYSQPSFCGLTCGVLPTAVMSELEEMERSVLNRSLLTQDEETNFHRFIALYTLPVISFALDTIRFQRLCSDILRYL
jgi:hypothetical protein